MGVQQGCAETVIERQDDQDTFSAVKLQVFNDDSTAKRLFWKILLRWHPTLLPSTASCRDLAHEKRVVLPETPHFQKRYTLFAEESIIIIPLNVQENTTNLIDFKGLLQVQSCQNRLRDWVYSEVIKHILIVHPYSNTTMTKFLAERIRQEK